MAYQPGAAADQPSGADHHVPFCPGFLHTKDRAAALQHSIFWTSVLFLNYLVIGYGNGNLGAIFGTVGIYVLLACTFLGPVAYAKIKRLK